LGIAERDQRDFASTRAIVDDIKVRTPRGASWLSDKAVTGFLKKIGCVPLKVSRSGVETRGWKFPPLAQMRREWEQRYGGWQWHDPELENWR
jgi:hypothetical protein